MNQIQKFQFNTSTITAVEYEGEPALLLSDVAAALQYADARDARKLLVGHPEAKAGRDYVTVTGERARTLANLAEGGSPSANKVRSYTIVRESGVYLLLMSSRTSVAYEFQGWAARELFPVLRRNELVPAAPVPAPLDLRDFTVLLAGALRDGLAPLADRVARLEAASGASSALPEVPPRFVTGRTLAATYGVPVRDVNAAAKRLRATYDGVYGVLCRDTRFAAGVHAYSPSEAAEIVRTLGLARPNPLGPVGEVFAK